MRNRATDDPTVGELEHGVHRGAARRVEAAVDRTGLRVDAIGSGGAAEPEERSVGRPARANDLRRREAARRRAVEVRDVGRVLALLHHDVRDEVALRRDARRELPAGPVGDGATPAAREVEQEDVGVLAARGIERDGAPVGRPPRELFATLRRSAAGGCSAKTAAAMAMTRAPSPPARGRVELALEGRNRRRRRRRSRRRAPERRDPASASTGSALRKTTRPLERARCWPRSRTARARRNATADGQRRADPSRHCLTSLKNCPRTIGAEVVTSARRIGGDASGDGLSSAAAERKLAAQALEEGRAERPDIGALVDVVGAASLFGRHVRGRTEHGVIAGERLGARRDLLGDSEIEDLHPEPAAVAGGQKEVRRLDVAMNDAGGMRGGEAERGLNEDVGESRRAGAVPRDGDARRASRLRGARGPGTACERRALRRRGARPRKGCAGGSSTAPRARDGARARRPARSTTGGASTRPCGRASRGAPRGRRPSRLRRGRLRRGTFRRGARRPPGWRAGRRPRSAR